MDHCVFCNKFIKKKINYKKPLSFTIYKELPLKTRLSLCKNESGPLYIFWCKEEVGPCYLVPQTCRFADDCLDCKFFLISKYFNDEELPKWLVDREEDFIFPLSVMYCSKRKKSAGLVIYPNNFEEFEKNYD